MALGFAVAAVLVSSAPALAVVPDTSIDSQPNAQSQDSSATFTFSSDTMVVTFECKRDAQISFSACTSPKTYTGLAEGSHTFAVRATNGMPDLSPATYTWTTDYTAPTTSVTAQPPALTKSPLATFEFSSPDATATFRCSLNGAPAVACTSPHTYSGLSDGTRTLLIQAVDAAGNTDSAAQPITWTVDGTPPDTTIASKPPSPDTNASPTFTATASEAGSTFACSLDGADFAPCSASAHVGPLATGKHHFAVRAIDAAGNPDPTPAGYFWIVDLTPPLAPKVLLLPDPTAAATARAAKIPPAQIVFPPDPIVATPTSPLKALVVASPPFVVSRHLVAQWTAGSFATRFDVTYVTAYAGTRFDDSVQSGASVKQLTGFTRKALKLTVPAGRIVCVSVTAYDKAGNASKAATTCTTVPFGLYHFPKTVDTLTPAPGPITTSGNGRARLVRDAKSWQGRFVTGVRGAGISYLTDYNPTPATYPPPTGPDCVFFCGGGDTEPAPPTLAPAHDIGILATTCPSCGRVQVSFTDLAIYEPVRGTLVRPETHATGPTLDLRSKRLHRSKLFIVAVPTGYHSGHEGGTTVGVKFLSGRPRVEGIASAPGVCYFPVLVGSPLGGRPASC